MNDSMSIYKPDWLEARQRLSDWWEGKMTDRPPAAVIAPSGRPGGKSYINKTPEKYTDFDTVMNNLDCSLNGTYWGGEAFPWHFVYMGPMYNAAYFGCVPIFRPDTTWYEPLYDSLDELLEMKADGNNKWWNLFTDITRRSAERSQGSYLVSTDGINSVIDIIAELIGTEKLLIAMSEEPEKVKAVRDIIASHGKRSFDDLYSLTCKADTGVINWMGVWCPEKAGTNQCDLSVMISPAMFDEFVKTDLESTYKFCEYGIYHLDGEGEIKHLDTLLKIDKLRLIQWVPSEQAGCPEYKDPMNWIDLFKRIQSAGKSVLIYCPPERITPLLKKIDRELVYLSVYCPNVSAAEQALRDIERA